MQSDFDAFWSAWARRVAKKEARKAWDKIPGNKQHIIEAARKWAHQWIEVEHREAHHIPHPATWLNGERWEDELPAPAKPRHFDPFAANAGKLYAVAGGLDRRPAPADAGDVWDAVSEPVSVAGGR